MNSFKTRKLDPSRILEEGTLGKVLTGAGLGALGMGALGVGNEDVNDALNHMRELDNNGQLMNTFGDSLKGAYHGIVDPWMNSAQTTPTAPAETIIDTAPTAAQAAPQVPAGTPQVPAGTPQVPAVAQGMTPNPAYGQPYTYTPPVASTVAPEVVPNAAPATSFESRMQPASEPITPSLSGQAFRDSLPQEQKEGFGGYRLPDEHVSPTPAPESKGPDLSKLKNATGVDASSSAHSATSATAPEQSVTGGTGGSSNELSYLNKPNSMGEIPHNATGPTGVNGDNGSVGVQHQGDANKAVNSATEQQQQHPNINPATGANTVKIDHPNNANGYGTLGDRNSTEQHQGGIADDHRAPAPKPAGQYQARHISPNQALNLF